MEVKVYTKPNCMQCVMTKVRLSTLGIPFEEIDGTDDETLDLLRSYGFASFPVVTVDGFDRSWCGFIPENIDELAE